MIRVFAKTDVPVMDIIELQGKIVITEEALRAARDAKERRRTSRRERRRRGAANSGTAVGEDASCTGDDLMPLSLVPSSSAEIAPRQIPASSQMSMHTAILHTIAAISAVLQTRQVQLHQRRVPLGHVEQDRLDEKRCTLCIDTLRVHGSRSSFKRPWLVLRECTPARMRKLRRQVVRPQIPRDTTILFSEWLGQHPDALSLNSLFLDDFATGDGDDVSGCGPTAAGSACAASASASSGRSGNGVGAHKRPREAENVGGTALDGPPFSPQSPQSASDVLSAAQTTAATVYKDYELVGVVRGSVLFNSKPARVFQ
ncbi:hypothetical protein CGC21_24235 [Leishmania donovani]|uniref:Uncharacterized protein n=1 Tax=Leishmania donovani TaxID=5661 RepID=A0A504Y9H3_LEIDO|nr:hypothetical protein CGC21_24235 [Leishmania donovani]